jgi:1-acyl-sn-glycerol-3-phosphate acyltransferase
MKERELTLSIILRSVICNCYFYAAVSFFIIFIFTPLSFLKSAAPLRKALSIYISSVIYIFEKVALIKIEERGMENITRGKGVIFCSKHMSNLDAHFLYRQAPNLTALAKAELLRVPFLGIIFKKMGVIAINRDAGEAQKQTSQIAKTLSDQKIPMIVFAEGTRTEVGQRLPLKSGTFYYQEEEDIDVIVVAHNSGARWPRRSWIKWPGTLIIEYFPPIPKGLSKEIFMTEIESRLLDRSEELML